MSKSSKCGCGHFFKGNLSIVSLSQLKLKHLLVPIMTKAFVFNE